MFLEIPADQFMTFSGAAVVSLLTLTIMEVVLGIDNIVFISIVASKLPKDDQPRARRLGLILAIIPRIILLLGIAWLIQLKKPILVIEAIHVHMSWKDLILMAGGMFLLYSSTNEIHHKLELEGTKKKHGKKETQAEKDKAKRSKKAGFARAMLQIILLNIVFSFDSVLTAVGLVDPSRIDIMIIAVLASTLIMMLFASPIANFVNNHPTVKMLALSFLLMIGFLLVAEAFHVEVPKGYVYFAMGFSLFVEMLNLRVAKAAALKAREAEANDEHEGGDNIALHI
jgi:predicted tellurium resistance membrane protein TerC